jgi:O-antigen ligase
MDTGKRNIRSMAAIVNRPQLLRLQSFLLLAAVCSIPLSIESNRIIVTALTVITVIATDWSKAPDNFRRYWMAMLPLSIGLVNLLGLAYTSDMKHGMSMLERSAFFGVLPLVLVLIPPDRRSIERLLRFFTIACLAVCFYCLAMALWKVFQTGGIVNEAKVFDREYYYFLNNELSLPAGISPIYLGLFLNLGIAYYMMRYIIWKERDKESFIILLLLHLFQGLLFALSAILALFFLWSVAICFLMLRVPFQRRIVLGIVFFCVIVVVGFGAYQVKPLRDKFARKLEYDMGQPRMTYWSGITLRLAIWKCAWDAVKETPIYGNGTGDAGAKLADAYKRNNFQLGMMFPFNSHNQYIETYLLQGVIGLFILLLVHLIPLGQLLAAGNWLTILFVAIMLMGYCSEVILGVQKGIVFFSFFFPLLYLYPARNK